MHVELIARRISDLVGEDAKPRPETAVAASAFNAVEVLHVAGEHFVLAEDPLRARHIRQRRDITCQRPVRGVAPCVADPIAVWRAPTGRDTLAPHHHGTSDFRLDLRFYEDPETGQPHIHQHGVSEAEVEDVLKRPLEDRSGAEASRVALGRTRSGRYLKVIYVPDPAPDSVFVITAYDLGPKAKQALRRRRKKKGS